jgi:hypothetical protein
LAQIARTSSGEVPFDARLFSFRKNTERNLFGLRLDTRVSSK